jgi:hypothetical protein
MERAKDLTSSGEQRAYIAAMVKHVLLALASSEPRKSITSTTVSCCAAVELGLDLMRCLCDREMTREVS